MADNIERMLIDNYETYYRFAFSIVKKREDALDVVQEAAYKAIKNKKKLKEPGHMDTWIHKIILNTAMDLLEKKKKECLQEDMDEPGNDNAAIEEGYGQSELKSVLDCLSADERGIVVMKYFEEMKISDIAAITGHNVNTVKSRLYRALNKLQDAFTIKVPSC